MDNRRYLIYCDMMTELKLTNQLMNEYDSLPMTMEMPSCTSQRPI